MTSIDPILSNASEWHPITGAAYREGYSNAAWSTTFEGKLGLRVVNAEGLSGEHHIPRERVRSWTDLNDTIDCLGGFGIDFAQNTNGARQLLRDYLQSIGDPKYRLIRMDPAPLHQNFTTQAVTTVRQGPVGRSLNILAQAFQRPKKSVVSPASKI